MVSAQLAASGSAPSFGTTGRRGGSHLHKHCRQRIIKCYRSSGSVVSPGQGHTMVFVEPLVEGICQG